MPTSIEGVEANTLPDSFVSSEESRGVFTPVNQIDIAAALAPYQQRFRMVLRANCDAVNREIISFVEFNDYPFTSEPIPYASLNLVNLAIEQILLVQLRNEVKGGKLSTSHWTNLEEYDRKVTKGHWLVPKIQTRLRRPVLMKCPVMIKAQIIRDRTLASSYQIDFKVVSSIGVSSNGVGTFVRELINNG